jgi:quercetin dioxygenase-like cupin family protein
VLSSRLAEKSITITPSGALTSSRGSAEYFTGTVKVDTLFTAHEPSCTTGARVTFEPGARTAWHSHPLGQTLIVTAGAGRIQQWGGPVQEIKQGDVVRIPPDVKHWHGAAADSAMTHIAIQESLDGKAADWKEQVTDQQYRPDPAP